MSALRRTAWVVVVAGLAGCESMPASGNLFAPVRETPAVVGAPASEPATGEAGEAGAAPSGAAPVDGFDFEGEDRPADDAKAKADALK